MLKNLSFRAKLALVLVPPLVVLVGLTAFVVRPELRQAADASAVLHNARLGEANMQYIDEVQLERLRTVQLLASGGRGGPAELAAARQQADGKRATFLAEAKRFAKAATPEQGQLLTAAVEAATGLDAFRSQVDSGQLATDDAYNDLTERIDTAIALNAELVLSANADAAVTRLGTSIVNLTQGKEEIADKGAFLLGRLEQASFTSADFADFKALDEQQTLFFEAFERGSAPDALQAYRAAIATDAATAVDRLSDLAIKAGSTGKLPAFTADQWLNASLNRLSAIDVPEDNAFAAYTARAGSVNSAARRNVIVVSLVTATAVLMAIAAAILLARSIVRRLVSISAEAASIATERLPEVLAALRNPTSEALQSAIPQVPIDARDEIGVMADAFNTVLRTSVQTSIEHSQRRAQTMTNMLVNLGRRNQALIDRQLELIDRLESSQHEPEVLEGLFAIDHMVTRMRRNAENLLVLASEQPARGWTEPVPMIDILRGAASEVKDLSRIVIELQPGDDAQVAGRFAVDLSHLLAELVENASVFSPPTANVFLRTERSARQYRIWIMDSGVGMNDEELADANERVSSPPDIDELTADRVGFQVVGRLARRLGITVRLQANPGGGTAACITLAANLFDAAPSLTAGEAEQAPPRPALAASPAVVSDSPEPTSNGLAGLASRATAPPWSPEAPLPAPGRNGQRAAVALAGPNGHRPSTAVDAPEPDATTWTDVDGPAAPGPAARNTPMSLAPRGPSLPPPSAAPPRGVTGGLPIRPVAALPSRETPGGGPPWSGSPASPAGAELPTRPLPAPNGPPSLPADTGGLVKRTPGAAFVPGAAEAFERGDFRRLPTPDGEAAAGEDPGAAQRRFKMLSALQNAVERGRDEPSAAQSNPIRDEGSR